MVTSGGGDQKNMLMLWMIPKLVLEEFILLKPDEIVSMTQEKEKLVFKTSLPTKLLNAIWLSCIGKNTAYNRLLFGNIMEKFLFFRPVH